MAFLHLLSMIDLVRDSIRVEAHTMADFYGGRVSYWGAMMKNIPASASNAYSSNRPNNEKKLNDALNTFYLMNGEN